MSRIENATLLMTMASAAAVKVYTYDISLNIFRVVSGLGALSYAV
jgi:hypothetical protein